jgi:homoserine O-acetyltransferase
VSERKLHVQHVPHFALECGTVLENVRQAYYLDGALDARRDNLVVVFHALTGDADAAGGWWREVIGPGRALDTDRFAVLSPNLLGSCYGTTGPADYTDGEFPPVTPRDQARLAGLLVNHLGAESPALVAGGSLGGMVALEWALEHPGRARAVVAMAAPAAHTAYAIGWNHIQRQLVEELGGRGIELARQVAMMTFRTEAELGERFGRCTAGGCGGGGGGEWQVTSWLDHHGRKLRGRFDAATYATLLGAMDAHDVGRGRGGVARALASLTGRVVAVGIRGDLLYSADEVYHWSALAGAEYEEITSAHGHDAFLLEHEQVGRILAAAAGGEGES